MRRRGRPRRRVHARARGARAGPVRASATSRRSGPGGRGRGGLPLRASARRRSRHAPRRSGSTSREVPLVEGVSSTEIRRARCGGTRRRSGGAARAVRSRWTGSSSAATSAAARSASRPRTSVSSPICSCPQFGIYAGAVGDRRAAVSIGVNPHYGGAERRIEAFLLDWSGDLYGRRLVVELWQRLRDERVVRERGRADRADRRRRRADPGGDAAGHGRLTLPLRRGSAPASSRPTALTPPKKWWSAGQRRTTRPSRSSDSSHASSTPGSALTRPSTGWNRGWSIAALQRRATCRARPRARRRAPSAAACRPPSRSRARAPSASKASDGAIMLAIRPPGTSGSRIRSTSPSMLFRCRSSPGSQSPEPSPRLVVSTHALPSRVDRGDVRRLPADRGRAGRAPRAARRRRTEAGERREPPARRRSPRASGSVVRRIRPPPVPTRSPGSRTDRRS